MMTRIRSLILCTALISLSVPAWANDLSLRDTKELQDFKVARLGDTELNCGQLSYEAERMQKIVAHKQAIQDEAEMKTRGIQAAGAVGSVILGAATAGIGLGVAGFLASEAIDQEADEADTLQDKASQRRSFMVGIYNAKGCEGPIEHVMLDPAPRDVLEQLASVEPAAGGYVETRTATANYAFQQPPRPEEQNIPKFGTAKPRSANKAYND